MMLLPRQVSPPSPEVNPNHVPPWEAQVEIRHYNAAVEGLNHVDGRVAAHAMKETLTVYPGRAAVQAADGPEVTSSIGTRFTGFIVPIQNTLVYPDKDQYAVSGASN